VCDIAGRAYACGRVRSRICVRPILSRARSLQAFTRGERALDAAMCVGWGCRAACISAHFRLWWEIPCQMTPFLSLGVGSSGSSVLTGRRGCLLCVCVRVLREVRLSDAQMRGVPLQWYLVPFKMPGCPPRFSAGAWVLQAVQAASRACARRPPLPASSLCLPIPLPASSLYLPASHFLARDVARLSVMFKSLKTDS